MTVFVADVSSAQAGGHIPQLQAAGIAAVIIKATEGSSYRNPQFPGWVAEARACGMPFAAYHFTHPGNAAGQAANIMAAVPRDVFVWLDDEAGATVADGQAIADILTAAGWTVDGQYNYARPAKGGWWRAAYLSDPTGTYLDTYARLGGDRAAEWSHGEDLWQYCQHGVVPGFTGGQVDFSAYRGTLDQLLATGWFWTPIPQPSKREDDDMAQLRIHPGDNAIYWINGGTVRHVPTMAEANELATELGVDLGKLRTIDATVLGYYTGAGTVDPRALAAAVVAALPAAPSGGLTMADVEAALRAVLHNA